MSLRPLSEADLSLILGWRNAPEVRRNMYSKHEITQEEHLSWFQRLQHDPQSLWFIHVDPEGRLDGVVYFTQYQAVKGNSFWGFYTAPKSLPGTGARLGFEAIDKAFFEMKLHKLNSEVVITNEASIRFHLKLGFKQEGLFRGFYFNGKKYIDVIRFGILEEDWVVKREEIRCRLAKRYAKDHFVSLDCGDSST